MLADKSRKSLILESTRIHRLKDLHRIISSFIFPDRVEEERKGALESQARKQSTASVRLVSDDTRTEDTP